MGRRSALFGRFWDRVSLRPGAEDAPETGVAAPPRAGRPGRVRKRAQAPAAEGLERRDIAGSVLTATAFPGAAAYAALRDLFRAPEVRGAKGRGFAPPRSGAARLFITPLPRPVAPARAAAALGPWRGLSPFHAVHVVAAPPAGSFALVAHPPARNPGLSPRFGGPKSGGTPQGVQAGRGGSGFAGPAVHTGAAQSLPGDAGDSAASGTAPVVLAPAGAARAGAGAAPKAASTGTGSASRPAVTAALTGGTPVVIGCSDVASLSGWTVIEGGGVGAAKGTVVSTAGGLVLTEGNSLYVGLKKTFTVPANPSTLSFSFDQLVFDTADTKSIKDAFEVGVVDAKDAPLVNTIARHRNAFYNATEGLPEALGKGTTVNGNGATGIETVTTDISNLLPGSTATLVLRLVNNDTDKTTSVRLRCPASSNLPPVVAVDLANDTAPDGPDADAYRTDRLTNDPTVAGTVRDDGAVTKLEASVDHGTYVDVTTALANGAFRWTPVGLAAGAHHVDVRATDNGALTAVAGTDFKVNAPPAAAAGGDRVVGEGDDVTFDAGGSTDPEGQVYAYHWAFADGTSADGKSVTRRYAQDGTDTATLTVTDSAGSTSTSVAHVVVQNRAPNVRPVADVTVPQGTAYDLTASFADPGVLDAHTATIYWGDGSSSPGVVREQNGSGTVTGSHVYLDNQTYTVTVTVSDDYSPPAMGSTTFHVVSTLVPPTVTISGPAALDEGSTYTLNLAARGPTPPAINSWTINWGDGTAPVTVPGYLTTASHLYPDGPNNYTVTATGTDANGTWASNALPVVVSNVAPTLTIAGPGAVNQGATYTLTLASGDPGQDTITGWDVNWGDGTNSHVTGNPTSTTHVYASGPHDYQVSATATDEDGTWNANRIGVHVNPAAPTVTVSGPGSTDEGATYTLTLPTTVSGGAVNSWTINWGDGTAVQTVTGNPASVTHVYQDGLNPGVAATVAATAKQGANNYAANPLQVTVNNVAPAITAVNDLNASCDPNVEGSWLSDGLSATFTDPGVLDTHTATIDWGDGTSSPGAVSEKNGRGTVTGNHVYADNGAYAVKVTVTDKDGASRSRTTTARVNNVAPKVTAGLSIVPNGPNATTPLVTIAGLFTDPGFTRASAGTVETFTVTIDWGDKTAVQTVTGVAVAQGAEGVLTAGNFSASHAYAARGFYRPKVTVTDDDRGVGTATLAFGMGCTQFEVVSAIEVGRPGEIPVKIYGCGQFDVDDINPSTLRFGPGGAAPDGYNVVPAQGGRMDVKFPSTQSAIRYNDTVAYLSGQLRDGTYFVDWAPLKNVHGGTPPTTSAPGTTKFFVADAATSGADTAYRYDATGPAHGSFAIDGAVSDPRGVAAKADGTRLWVLDGTSQEVAVQGTDGTPLGSFRAFGLTRPTGIASNGTDLWVVDASTRQIVKYAGAAALTAGAVTPTATLRLDPANTSPSDITTRDGSVFWVTDDAKRRVFVYDANGATLGSWNLDAADTSPSGITVNPSATGGSDVWVVDRATKKVYAYAGAMAWRGGNHAATSSFALAAANAHPEAIADPPAVTVSGPADGSGAPGGSQVLVSGTVTGSPPGSTIVAVNGVPVDAVDMGNNFFSSVPVSAGPNAYGYAATAAAGQTGATTTVHVNGQGPPAGPIDFGLLSDVTSSFKPVYGRTSLDQSTSVLYADMAAQNVGTFEVMTPLIVAVKNVSDPDVRPRDFDGVAPDGSYYYDYSKLVGGGLSRPNDTTGSGTLAFYDPSGRPFTYTLVFLGRLNHAPTFASVPVVETPAAKVYNYQSAATDPDPGQTLRYSLVDGPAGMTVNPDTGLVSWSLPGSPGGSSGGSGGYYPPGGSSGGGSSGGGTGGMTNGVGTHFVAIRVDDLHGGSDVQKYVLNVVQGLPNRPPQFVTTPVVDAYVNVPYAYPSHAADPDLDPLTYAVADGPAGLAMPDTTSGRVRWTPTYDQLGPHTVTLTTADGRGGTAVQTYTVVVHPQPGNHPPKIVTTPVQHVYADRPDFQPGDPNDTVFTVPGVVGQPVDVTFTLTDRDTNYQQNEAGFYRVLDAAGRVLKPVTPLKFDFGTLDSPVAAGYTGVAATAYNATTGYGWLPAGGMTYINTQDRGAATGSDLTRDANLVYFGSAFEADVPNGVYTASIMLGDPAGPGQTNTVSFLGGQVTDTVVSAANQVVTRTYTVTVTGGKFTVALQGTGGTGYVASTIEALTLTPQSPPPTAFDFGTATSPVASGYVGVSSATAYTAARGYGWTSGTVTDADRAAGTDLSRDLNATADGTFSVDVANGRYLVTMTLGDPGAAVASDLMAVALEGTRVDTVSTPDGILAVRKYFVTVADGRLDVNLRDLGGTGASVGIESLRIQAVLAPGDPGYMTAALDPSNSQVVEASGMAVGDARTFTFQPGDLLAFYIVQNNTTQAWRRTNPDNSTSIAPMAFSSIPAANSDGQYDHLRAVSRTADGRTVLGWEDLTSGGDADFNDIEFTADISLLFGARGELYSYQVRAVDPDNDPIVYSLTQGPADAAFDKQTGLLTWSAKPGATDFTVRADDGRGGYDTQTWTLLVDDLNTGSVYGTVYDDRNNNGFRDTGEPGTANVTVFVDSNHNGAYDAGEPSAATDADGRYAITGLALGTYTVAEVPPSGWAQTDPAAHTYTVEFSAPGYAVGKDFGNHNPSDVNHAPHFTSPAPPETTVAYVGQWYPFQAAATDADNDHLVFDLPVHPAGMAVDPVTGALWYLPVLDDAGKTVDALVRVKDGRGGVDLLPIRLTVSATETAPILTTLPTIQPTTGVTYTAVVRAQDAEGDPLVFRLDPAPADVTLTRVDDNSALLTWTNPTAAKTITVVADDQRGGTDVRTFTLTPAAATNHLPVIDSTPRGTIQLGQAYVYAVKAHDNDGDALHYGFVGTAPAGWSIDASGVVRWTPTSLAAGGATVKVWDDRGVATPTTQAVNVTVVSQMSNRDPVIDSAAVPTATVGRTYAYDMHATDPDNDPIVWSLDDPPTGLSIDPSQGTLRWWPTPDQVGTHTVTARVRDLYGGSSTQTFTVTVRGVDQPPRITSTPPVTVAVGQAYAYAVRAVDPDNDPLLYTVAVTPPAGVATPTLAFDANHVLRWANPAAAGNYTVAVTVDDQQGGTCTQTFTLVVGSTAANGPPSITSKPLQFVKTAAAYSYAAAGTDPDGDTLTFTMPGGPGWLTMDANGLLHGTAPAGATTATVQIQAADGHGNYAEQTFSIAVTADTAPYVVTDPTLTVTRGIDYRSAVGAKDDQGDPITYALDAAAAAAGMTIDAFGRLSWPSSAMPAAPATRPFTVTVTDPYGLSSQKSYTLAVAADASAPAVDVKFSANPAAVGGDVTVLVLTTDNVGVASITLTVDGTPLPLDAHGSATYHAGHTGTIPVSVTVKDAAGNTTTVTPPFSVGNPNDVHPPTAAITAPADGSIVTVPTDVIGSVSDDTPGVTYSLDAVSRATGAVTPINSGGAVTNGVLGRFDPTMLANGLYTLRLSAVDAGAHATVVEEVVQVAGQLKLGNFHVAFTDLTIPVAGIPITITRSYDTLNAAASGDFGYGWNLSTGNVTLTVQYPDSGLGGFGDRVPFRDGTRVSVTGPDGETNSYTFQPYVSSSVFGIPLYYAPYFRPDPGVTTALKVPTVDLTKVGDEYVSEGDGGISYNPADPAFGNTYTLADYTGLERTVDATTGTLTSMSDRNGNTLHFHDDGITSDSGRGVAFVRDFKGRITAITDPRGHSITYTYSPAGDLTAVADRAGKTTAQFTYRTDRPHYLDRAIDAFNRTAVQASYAAADGRLSSLTDAATRVTTLAYDLNALTATATAPLTNPATTGYDGRGNPTKVVDPQGHTTLRTYSGDWVTSETQVVGQVDSVANGEHDDLTTTYTRDPYGNILTATDPLKNVTRYTYDAYGLPLTQSDALGNTAYFSYDPRNGNVLLQVDPLGTATAFSYDDKGRVSTVTTGHDGGTYFFGGPPGGAPVPPAGQTFAYTYNQFGDVRTSSDGYQNVTTFDYDENGNPTGNQKVWIDPANPSHSQTVAAVYRYDENDRLYETDSLDGSVVTTAYDDAGRPYQTRDNRQQDPTTTLYDVRSQVIRVTAPDGTVTDTVFDDKGRPVWTDDPHPAGKPAHGTHTVYDDNDRPIAVERYADVVIAVNTPPTGPTSALTSAGTLLSVTRTVYDDAGRVVWTDTPHDPSQSTSGTHTVYDAGGRVTAVERRSNVVISVSSPGSHPVSTVTSQGTLYSTTASTYDAAGRVVKSTDALSHSTQATYDDGGRVVKTTYDDGSYTTAAYDRLGRKTAETDQNGLETDYQYDGHGNLTAVVLPAVVDPATGRATRPTYRYGYDNYGNLVSTRDPLSVPQYGNGYTRQTTDHYDALGRRDKHTLPMGQSETWTFNGLGQTATHTDFNGQVTAYDYDAAGRPWHKSLYAPGAPSPTVTVTYAYGQYDASGFRHDSVGVTQGSATATTESVYDLDGQLVQVTSPEGTVHYGYDAAGRKTHLWTTQTDVVYHYDPFGRLDSVTTGKLNGATISPLTATYAYDLADRLVTTAFPNGTTETRSYDTLDRLSSVTTKSPSNAVLAGYTYTLDKAGHRTGVLENTGRQVTYTYDNLYRLTQESIADPAAGSRTLGYTYDLAGNRVARTDSGAPSSQVNLTYAYDANDRLTQLTGGYDYSLGGQYGQTYTYDANGATKTVTGTGGANSAAYTWDLDGRLSHADTTNGVTHAQHHVDYTYDDAGNRTSQTADGQKTAYLNDTNLAYDQVLEEYAPGGVLAATYVRGADLLFQDRSGTRSFYAKDGLGSIRTLTNSSGFSTDRYNYDSYGNLLDSTGATTNEFLFAGYQQDAATGLSYLRARYLDTSAGRFMSRDVYNGRTIDPITLNHYAYAGNNPICNIDPSGRDFIGTMVTASIIGGIAGGTIGYINGGAKGFVYGAISGAVVGPAVTAAAIGGGMATSATLLYFGYMFSPQVATFVIGTAIAAYNVNSIRSRLDSLDMSDPTAERQMAAADTELAFTLIGWTVGAAALGRAQYIRDMQALQIRDVYKATAREVARIGSANQNATGAALEATARQVHGMRHQARMSCRDMMKTWLDLRTIQLRDLVEYGNPDGPTFDFLIKKAISKGFSGDDIYRFIISGAARTNAAVDAAFKPQTGPK